MVLAKVMVPVQAGLVQLLPLALQVNSALASVQVTVLAQVMVLAQAWVQVWVQAWALVWVQAWALAWVLVWELNHKRRD